MSKINNNMTLPKAINISETSYQQLLRSSVINSSKVKRPGRDRYASDLIRAELIHLGNVRTRNLLTTRNIKTQDNVIQGPRNVMENKSAVNQTLSKIGDKLTSLFSKRNFLAQGTRQIQSSTTVSNPTLVNQNVYPVAGNVAASTDTNTAISIQAGETPAESAINIINLNSSELAQYLPAALNQSIKTVSKMSERFAQAPINASLL